VSGFKALKECEARSTPKNSFGLMQVEATRAVNYVAVNFHDNSLSFKCENHDVELTKNRVKETTAHHLKNTIFLKCPIYEEGNRCAYNIYPDFPKREVSELIRRNENPVLFEDCRKKK
jgi:hypothetical protein